MRFYFCFLLFFFSGSYLFAQQPFSYDTAIALDCSKDRYLSVGGKLILVPKNTVFKLGSFKGYTPGMGFGPTFQYEDGLTESLISDCDSFIKVLDDERKESSFYEAGNGYYYNDKHPFLKIDSIYQLLLSYNHYNDTFIQEGICAPGLGWNLIDYKSPGQQFKPSCQVFSGFCMCDSTMYGTFRDIASGEELRIFQSPLSVEYRSKKQPHWKKLYLHENKPGFLLVGFSKDRSFVQQNYELKFNGECWIIPSLSSYITERNRANPQFFKRVNP